MTPDIDVRKVMLSILKHTLIILLSLIAAAIIAMLFFADFGPGETIYTRSLIATFLSAVAGLMLGYVLKRWAFAAIPVVFPLILVILGIFRGSGNMEEYVTLLLPILGSFGMGYLGVVLARHKQLKLYIGLLLLLCIGLLLLIFS